MAGRAIYTFSRQPQLTYGPSPACRQSPPLLAALTHVDGKKVAEMSIRNEDDANVLVERILAATFKVLAWCRHVGMLTEAKVGSESSKKKLCSPQRLQRLK